MPASAGQPGCRVWLYPSVEAEARGWAAARRGEFRMEERKTGRGERSRPDGAYLIAADALGLSQAEKGSNQVVGRGLGHMA